MGAGRKTSTYDVDTRVQSFEEARYVGAPPLSKAQPSSAYHDVCLCTSR